MVVVEVAMAVSVVVAAVAMHGKFLYSCGG